MRPTGSNSGEVIRKVEQRKDVALVSAARSRGVRAMAMAMSPRLWATMVSSPTVVSGNRKV